MTPADCLLQAASCIDRAIMTGHPIWGDGQALDRGWRAMLAWNLGIAGLCAQAVRGRAMNHLPQRTT
jgi:hypothetical protein